ncbi:MAG: flagellar hook capping protein [Lachnospiraceae bacterium]|jgi:flagellar basal-body rod modification protein FlgD|nr:flagellar hook capping protein [Lachnospiraceae bacterium]
MSLVSGLGAAVDKGSIVVPATSISAITKGLGGANGMDKEAFLNLLVAQMKYQDPLEPTSNTEFISQFATFSQLEQMQNMSASLELSRASSYVGHTVTVRTRMTNGEFREIEGRVDYVIYENNRAFLSIEGNLYRADDVFAVVDPQYKMAYDLAMAFAVAVNILPSLENLTLSYAEQVDNLKDGYNAMTAYQQSFIANDLLERLQAYVARIELLREAAGGQSSANSDDDEQVDGDADD